MHATVNARDSLAIATAANVWWALAIDRRTAEALVASNAEMSTVLGASVVPRLETVLTVAGVLFTRFAGHGEAGIAEEAVHAARVWTRIALLFFPILTGTRDLLFAPVSCFEESNAAHPALGLLMIKTLAHRHRCAIGTLADVRLAVSLDHPEAFVTRGTDLGFVVLAGLPGGGMSHLTGALVGSADDDTFRRGEAMEAESARNALQCALLWAVRAMRSFAVFALAFLSAAGVSLFVKTVVAMGTLCDSVGGAGQVRRRASGAPTDVAFAEVPLLAVVLVTFLAEGRSMGVALVALGRLTVETDADVLLALASLKMKAQPALFADEHAIRFTEDIFGAVRGSPVLALADVSVACSTDHVAAQEALATGATLGAWPRAQLARVGGPTVALAVVDVALSRLLVEHVARVAADAVSSTLRGTQLALGREPVLTDAALLGAAVGELVETLVTLAAHDDAVRLAELTARGSAIRSAAAGVDDADAFLIVLSLVALVA